jgi:hypothetical protein
MISCSSSSDSSSSTSSTSPKTTSFYYTLTGTGISSVTSCTVVNGSGGTVSLGTVSLPFTSSTYSVTNTASGMSPELTGTFTGSGSVVSSIYDNTGTLLKQQTYTNASTTSSSAIVTLVVINVD